MSLSVIINTIALADDANRISSGGRPYSDRAWLLRNVILPWYDSMGIFDQVIVVGEFEDGPFHDYVPFPQQSHTVADALLMRDAGTKALRCNDRGWVLYQHDDHLWDPRNQDEIFLPSADVLAPARRTRARGGQYAEEINDGHEDGYINGHGLLMRRCVAERVPWASVEPVHTWDIEYTKALKDAGIEWCYAPEYAMLDIEPFADPFSDARPVNYLRPVDEVGLDLYRSGSTEPWTADVVAALAVAIHASVVVETGTYEARTTLTLWDALRGQDRVSHLHTVDSDPARANSAHRAIKERIAQATGPNNCMVSCHTQDAVALLNELPEGQADLVFLDDDHTLGHVAVEVVAALRALRPRGLLCMHDVCGHSHLGELVRAFGGAVLDFPKLHASGGLGVIVK